MAVNNVSAEFPTKLQFLFKPKKYKIAYGGRGSGKSWGYARALIILMHQAAHDGKPIRVLCTREVQKSIKDSVHRLLSDQIAALELLHHFTILETEIRHNQGGEFLFAGLATHTVASIKSFEGVDVCWVEEAQTVSKKSWDVLLPTIRKRGSEVWVTFNPDLDTDETYVRWVVETPDDTTVCKINWHDNFWWSDELEAQRQHTLRTRPEDYANIWEGECKAAIDGAIYAQEMAAVVEENRVINIPIESRLKTHAIFDLGFNDCMTIVLAQRQGAELRVVGYIEDSQRTLEWYSGELKRMNIQNWGKVWLPHDGAYKDFKTGKSAQQIMTEYGWTVDIIPRTNDIEQDINFHVRPAFKNVWFDRASTERLRECLKRYRRNLNAQDPTRRSAPLHDEFSHGADAFRYTCMVADRLSNDNWGGELKYTSLGVV
jgi:phage terminase large subunit